MFSIPSSDENSSYGAEKYRMPKMSPPLLRESVHGTLGTYTSTNQLKDSENSQSDINVISKWAEI